MIHSSPEMWGSDDRRWMRRALRLASLSLGATAPNPGVGCVLVRDGKLLGEGRHKQCGQGHAEVEALADAQANGHNAQGATAYVTLAPCTSQGRTPACSTALIRAQVARVVAAIDDPLQEHPQDIFAAAGIVYVVGCERELAEHIHGGWLTRARTGLPRCTGKWAVSLDGFIANTAGQPVAISCSVARDRTRRRRRAFDAIVVGAQTVAADDPQLLSTLSPTPARVVISARARIPEHSRLLASLQQAPLWLIHDQRATADTLSKLQALGVITLAVTDAHNPNCIKQALAAQGCNEVLVEGGAQVHGAFLAAGAYDRLEIDRGSMTLGGGIPVAQGSVPSATTWQAESPSQRCGHTQTTHWCRVR